MSEIITYEEVAADDELLEAKVTIETSETRVRVIAEAVDDDDEMVLSKINQHDTTLIDDRGLPLMVTALETLAHRLPLNARGLFDAEPSFLEEEPDPGELEGDVEVVDEQNEGDEDVPAFTQYSQGQPAADGGRR